MISSKAHERVRLADAFWFQEGPGVRNWQFTQSGIKLLNVGNITATGEIDLSKTDRHLSIEEVEQKYSHFLVDEGDLVIASSGISFDSDGLLRTRGGFVKKEHLPLCMNTSTIRFRPQSTGSDINFLKFWLDSYEFRHQITTLVTGSAQQNFGPSHLRQLKITLPPLAEQQRIADILSRADRLRRLRRFALEMSAGYLQAVFLEMFGDPVTNPMGWEVVKLGQLIRGFEAGVNFPPVSEGAEVSEWRVLKISAVTWGEFDQTESKPISAATKFRNSIIARKGDLLMSRANTTELVGAVSRIRSEPHRVLLPDKLWRLCFFDKDSKVTPNYILFALRQAELRRIIGVLATGSSGSMKNISMQKAATLPILVPPLDLQMRFSQVVEQYDRLYAQQQEALRQAEHLFQGLLQAAFRGDV